ncbi:hypothetical protein A3K63_04190 [Candidatus Micrarchaeota archaeon RBG_16_49_10]|nr:MAG: hypothetical protein A3K63_04190 [Candidatus Micrarchaeota archaeon RBG_16_49_10]
MPIVAYHIDEISAKKGGIPKGAVDIKSGSKIVSVDKTETGMFKKYDGIAVSFEFRTDYEPNVAEIVIRGKVVYAGEDVKESLKTWGKEKKLVENVEVEVRNFLFRKCLGMGITITENMNLPPPLLFPMVAKRPKKNEINPKDLRYIG